MYAPTTQDKLQSTTASRCEMQASCKHSPSLLIAAAELCNPCKPHFLALAFHVNSGICA